MQQHTLRQSATPPSVELTHMFDPPHAPPDADPALEAAAQQCLEALQGALNRLSPRARAAFLLHRRDGLSFDEIGAHLSLSRPMVKKYLLKALMQLRLRLDPAD